MSDVKFNKNAAIEISIGYSSIVSRLTDCIRQSAYALNDNDEDSQNSHWYEYVLKDSRKAREELVELEERIDSLLRSGDKA